MITSANKLKSTLFVLGCLAISSGPVQAQATTVVIESTEREAINDPELVDLLSNRFKVVGRSYQVRAVNGGTERGSVSTTRPVYAFPLSSAQGQSKKVLSATLTFLHPEISISGPDGDEAIDPTETMTFKSIEKFTVSDLNSLPGPSNSNPGDLALCKRIFDDLGDGLSYGTLTASKDNNGKEQTVSLNVNAIRELNKAIAAGDDNFIIGGTLTSGREPGNGLPRGVQERIFRGSDDSGGFGYPEIKLTLTFDDPPPPVPALGGIFGLSLLGTGLGGVGLAARRRKRKRA